MHIPHWLKQDVKALGLDGVRLTCAIYELYDKYANGESPYDIDERLAHLTLVNKRLDYLDNNVLAVKYAISMFDEKEEIIWL